MPWPERPAMPAGGRITAEMMDAIGDEIEWLGTHQTLSADHSGMTNSTTRVSTNLSIPVLASTTYKMEADIISQAGSTGDLNPGLSLPSGATVIRAWAESPPATRAWPGGNVADQWYVGTDTSSTVFVVPGGNSATDVMHFRYVVLFTTSTTAGNAIFQYAQSVSNGTLTQVKRGSSWQIKRSTLV